MQRKYKLHKYFYDCLKSNILVKSLTMVVLLLAMLAGVLGSFFIVEEGVQAAGETDNVILRDLPYPVMGKIEPGIFRINSANVENDYFDINGGSTMNERVQIIPWSSGTAPNQKFMFVPVEAVGNSYVYKITTIYKHDLVLDIDGASTADGAKLQTYTSNDTNAQRFMIKEVFQKNSKGEYEYVGLALLTGCTNYQKVLARTDYEGIRQKTFNKNSLDKNQVWHLEVAFSGYSYKDPGYLDINKVYNGYNVIDYSSNSSNNDNKGFYGNFDYWEKFEEFLTIDKNSSWKASKSRITEYGYTFLDSANLEISVDNTLKFMYQQILWKKYYIEIGDDKSEKVNGKYVGGTVNKGTMEIEYTDQAGKSYSVFSNNIFQGFDNVSPGTKVSVNNKYNGSTFNRVGKYTIRIYYKVQADWETYNMKEFSFGIISSSCDAEALKTDKADDGVLASYKFSLNSSNNIAVNYNGNSEYKAPDTEIINYISGAANESTQEEKNKKIEAFKNEIKAYGEYKVYFTNTAFYLNAKGNKFVIIQESINGYNTGVTQTHLGGKSPSHPTDGVYYYTTQNQFGNKKCRYVVFVQCQPNKQVFRNVTYAFQDEKGEVINYAIDYAFLEDLKIFPYTMTKEIYYQDFSEGKDSSIKVNYKSNSIIYNTSNDIMKLKFTVKDISGNVNTLNLYIYPPNVPSLNEENLKNASYKYNYITTGYSVRLYESGKYKDNLFSSYDIALENLMANIVTNKDICIESSTGSYTLKFNPYGNLSTKTFANNSELVKWIYDYAEDNIKHVTITPKDYENYKISEKDMHFDTLYLTKDFKFTTDKYFPLFESYKIYFEYYSNNNKLIKEGIITYDGLYKYGQTMLQILADNKTENWQEGYVKFVEYNISANSGNSYTAKIVTSNSTIQIKHRDGTIFDNKSYNKASSFICEEFQLIGECLENTTILVTYGGNTTIYNTFNFENLKFNKTGVYFIEVMNTHGYAYKLTIKVEGLASYVTGVSNFGTTTSDVTFKINDLNFEYYINGSKQSNNNYTDYDGKTYIFKFTKQDIDSNIYITKNGKVFSFIIKGNKTLDLSDYYVDEDKYYSVADCLNFKHIVIEEFNVLEGYVEKSKNLIDKFTVEEQEVSVLSTNDYNSRLGDLKTDVASVDEILKYNEYFESINNSLFKTNYRYNKFIEFQENIKVLESLLNDKIADFHNFAINYFTKQGIEINGEIYEEIKYSTEDKIKQIYTEYLGLRNNYNNKIQALDAQIAKVNDMISVFGSYNQRHGLIDSIDKIARAEQLAAFVHELESNVEQKYTVIDEAKVVLNANSTFITTNPFAKNTLVKPIQEKAEELKNCIKTLRDCSYNDKYNAIKQDYIDTVNASFSYMVSQVQVVEKEYLAALEEVRDFEDTIDDKEWWEFISKLVVQGKLKKVFKKVEQIYSDNVGVQVEVLAKTDRLIATYNSMNKTENVKIEKYIIEGLELLKEGTNTTFNRIKDFKGE